MGSITDWWGLYRHPRKGSISTTGKKTPGKFITVLGGKCFVFKANIFKADAYTKVNAGSLTSVGLKTLYDRDEGFGIQFDGTNERLTLSWRSVVDHAD